MSTATLSQCNTIDDSELSEISTETDTKVLVDQLVSCMSVTVQAIKKIAFIVRRLDELNFDIESLRLPNIGYFRKVADGKMVPELFVSLIGAPIVLRKVSNLSILDQKRITEGQPIKVMLQGGDHMMIRVKDMTNEQARQVFAHDHIRNDQQQAAWLVERAQMAKGAAVAASPITIDRRRNGIVVGDVFVSANDLANYLGALAAK